MACNGPSPEQVHTQFSRVFNKLGVLIMLFSMPHGVCWNHEMYDYLVDVNLAV
jgi:hypothetical protein